MNDHIKNLQKLLQFINEISKKEGNEWFRGELIKMIAPSPTQTNIEDIDIINDLKRSKFYLKSIDRTTWVEALNFYSHIKDPILKLQLCSDFKEMKIADKNDDIIEYTRRLVMQLENLLNSLCLTVDAYKTINENPNVYINKYIDKKTGAEKITDLTSGAYSFFNSDGRPKPLNYIDLPTKVFFAKQYYNIQYKFSDIYEMTTIRNKSSHRGETTIKEKEILENAQKNITEKKSSYFNCYNTFYNSMKDLKKKY